MKKNLIKILAIASIALAAGACKGKTKKSSEAPVVTIQELLELNNEGKWALEGQTVKIENLSLQGKYGNTLIGGTSVGETVVDLRGVEIRCKELPALERSGYGADISAEGRVVDVNGRLTLQDAVVTVNSERGEDGKYTEGHGLPIHYCGTNATSRALFDGYFSRIFSGALIEGIFQLASVPGQMSATSEAASFSVAFPGEDLDTADAANESLITINYAAGSEVSDKAVEGFNKYFEGKKAGDFVTICANLQWDNQANAGGMGMILENYWMQLGLTEVEDKDKPVIYASWADMQKANNSIFDGGMINLGPAMIDDDSNPETPDVPDPADKLGLPFSYTVDKEYLDDPKGPWKDEYKDQLVLVADPKACADLVITANFKPAGIDDYFNAIKARLTGLADPFVLNESFAESGIYIFTQTIESKVVKEVLVQANNASSFDIHLIAPKSELKFATFADFKARLELTASAKVSDLSGAAYTHTSALPAFPAANTPASLTFQWMHQDDYDSAYALYGSLVRYDFVIEFADATKAAEALAAYKTTLAGASFSEKYFDLFDLTGFYNGTSKEFINISREYDSKAKAYTANLKGYIFILDAKSSTHLVDLPASDAALVDVVAGFYTGLGYANGTALPSDLGNGAKVTTRREYSLSAKYDANGLLIVTLTIDYSAALDNADFQAIAAKFGSLQAATCKAFAVDGYWNSTSEEFFMFGLEGSTLEITIIKVWSSLVASYIELKA